jgi:chromosome segregation ATPase
MRLNISELSAQLSALWNEKEAATQEQKMASDENSKRMKLILQLQQELREIESASNAKAQLLEAKMQELNSELESSRLKSGERIPQLENEVRIEKSRAITLENRLQLAYAERDAQVDSLQKREAEHADRCRELADRISAAEGETARLSKELEDLRKQFARETEKADTVANEMAKKEAEKETLERELSAAKTALSGMERITNETEVLKNTVFDASTELTAVKERLETATFAASKFEADAAELRAELAKQREKADHAISVAERAVEQQLELAHKLEAAASAEADAAELRKQLAKGKGDEVDRALKSETDFRERYEVSKQKVQELEQKIVDMQIEFDNEKHEIDLELTELYGLVDQQKESGDRGVSESEQYKAEMHNRRSDLILARWHYISKLLLLQRMELSAADKSLATPARRAMFAEPLEDPERTTDASQVQSQATSQDTTCEAEGFENLPPLEMSSRKRTIRYLIS